MLAMDQECDDALSDDLQLNGDYEGSFCRDYLRKVCRRGKRCKYIHSTQLPLATDLRFCHDYQNKLCFRSNCKFVHCSREEEDSFRTTGDLPPSAIECALRQGLLLHKDPPVCKDHLKRNCKRGNTCKFRHVESGDVCLVVESSSKRRRLEAAAEALAAQAAVVRKAILEDENETLKRRLNETQRQLTAMASTAEMLLEQNARLRLSSGPVVSLPAVTITNAQAVPPVTIAAAMAPGSVTQVSLAASGISIAPPIVTVAQTLAPPNQGTLQAQPIPISISAAQAPIVSFPIVATELHPQLTGVVAR